MVWAGGKRAAPEAVLVLLFAGARLAFSPCYLSTSDKPM